MPSETFRIAYEGPAVDDGKMHVVDLASALGGLGHLFREANRILNGDRAEVSVQVEARFQRGSFEISLEVTQQLLQAAKQFLLSNREVIASAKDLIGLLGALGLFALIKMLKGRKPKTVVDVSLDLVTVTADDGTTINVRREALQLYEYASVKEEAARIVAPLARPGVEVLEVRSSAGETIERVTKEEADAFRAAASTLPVQPIVDSPRTEETVVRVKKPWLTREGLHKWTLHDGRGDFSAYIDDADFMQRIDAGEIKIGSRDAFRVLLRVDPGDGPGAPVIYSVIGVTEYMPAPKQQPFPPPHSDDED